MKQIDSAQLIWDALADAQANGERGLTKRQIHERTGLGYSQIGYGLRYIDDVLQLGEGRPRAYHPYWRVYTLSQTWAEHSPYIDVRWKSILTQMLRQEKNLTASAMAFHDDPVVLEEILTKRGTLQGAIASIRSVMKSGAKAKV